MNDCLLESENFQITKSDNNKYLLLPVKKQQAEKFVLKECGKDIDSDTSYPSFTHTHNHLSTHIIFFIFYEIKFAKNSRTICHQEKNLTNSQCFPLSVGRNEQKIHFHDLSVETWSGW